MIDYERMQRTARKHKMALTKAMHKSDPESRFVAVNRACQDAVREWNQIGAWPDGWNRWQVALTDAFYNLQRNPQRALNPIPAACPRLEEF